MVTSRIAKGRVTRVDASEALRVDGVIDVLTHKNRPHMADADGAYKDDVAPDGSPFRPLYDDMIRFSGQPIALVVAEESEIARFEASLVRVEYDEEPHVTDPRSQRDAATVEIDHIMSGRQNRAALPKLRSLPPRCATLSRPRPTLAYSGYLDI